MSDFTEYKTTRAKKLPEDLASTKDWQANARRLNIPLDGKKYGLKVKEWEEQVVKNGKPATKKCHAITWKVKPYCKLLLNNKPNAKDFAMLEVNTTAGLAIQVNPANFGKFYISIPKGALPAFPRANTMLNYKQDGAKLTISKK